jgi:hypothetical protein
VKKPLTLEDLAARVEAIERVVLRLGLAGAERTQEVDALRDGHRAFVARLRSERADRTTGDPGGEP